MLQEAHWGYSLDVVIFEGYSPLNNMVIQWTCVILEVFTVGGD